MGPFGHFWYSFLDGRFPKRCFLTVVGKVIGDQLVAAPIFNAMVIGGTNVLDGKGLQQIIDVFKEKFITIYMVCIF